MPNHNLAQAVELLCAVFLAEKRKGEHVKRFQDFVWLKEGTEESAEWDLLGDLAYDLDFYEPRRRWRKQSPDLWGDDVLSYTLMISLKELKELGVALPAAVSLKLEHSVSRP